MKGCFWVKFDVKKFLALALAAALALVLGVPEALAAVTVDATNFPDANFRAYMSTFCDADSDGTLSDAEIAAVTLINVLLPLESRDIAYQISSLKGIRPVI